MTLWENIILTVISVSIPVLIGYGLKLFGGYIEEKTHSVRLQRAFRLASDTVESVVDATTQTFVDALKGTPDWNADTMKQAFNQSTQKATQLISTDVKQMIQNETGDFDTWLGTKIEQTVQAQK